MRTLLFSVIALGLQCTSGFCAEERPRLNRADLLTAEDPAGAPHRIQSPAEWSDRRNEILAAMQEIMGPVPGPEKRCPLDVLIEEETDCGDHIRRFLTYQSEPGNRVPAYLLIPKAALKDGSSPTQAVLCLHPTNDAIGHKVVVGLGQDPGRAYAAELTRRGFVTVAPAYPLLANYQPDLRALRYSSGTMKAVWDNMRALDLLESLPFVKHDGFAAIGHSLGGHNAIYTAAFEPRIKVVISSCGFDSYQDYYSGNPNVWLPGKGWTQERYMPRLSAYRGRLQEIPFDFDQVIAALAPRALFVNAPLRDANFQWRSVDRAVGSAKQVYELYGAADHVVVEHPDTIHEFPETIRDKAYQFIADQLR